MSSIINVCIYVHVQGSYNTHKLNIDMYSKWHALTHTLVKVQILKTLNYTLLVHGCCEQCTLTWSSSTDQLAEVSVPLSIILTSSYPHIIREQSRVTLEEHCAIHWKGLSGEIAATIHWHYQRWTGHCTLLEVSNTVTAIHSINTWRALKWARVRRPCSIRCTDWCHDS